MSNKTSIEWTRGDDGTAGATWNPVRGCVKVSPGCKHCYAETFAERFRGVKGHAYERGFEPRTVPEKLDEPLRWKRPRRIFVNSMSDLFGEFVLPTFRDAVFARMLLTPRHTYQVLTKRAAHAMAYLSSGDMYQRVLEAASEVRYAFPETLKVGISNPTTFPAKWIWMGVSVEDRKYGVPRIDHLRNTPAAVRFLSIEPLLEDVGKLDLTGIHQVIVGAESGQRARPMNEDWVRSIRDQAKAAGCAFFYKQKLNLHGKKVSLPMLDGRQWAEMPVVGGAQ